MAERWSSEYTVTEHRDLQASAMAVDSTGTYVLLAGRRYLAIKNLEDEQPDSLRKFARPQSNYEVSVAEWNPSLQNKEICAIATNQKIELLTWNTSDFSTTHSVRSHTRVVSDLNWHHFDINIFASCSIDTFIHIWDIRDMRRPSLSLSAIAGATQVRWNRLNEHLLATAHDGDIKLWDQRKGTIPVQYIAAHLSKIHGLDWSPQHENRLATSSQDGTVKFFNISNPKRAEYILNTGSPVWRARFTPFGEGLVTVVVPQLRRGFNRLLLWNTVNQAAPVHTFVGHTDVVLEFEWRPQRENSTDYQLVTWSKDQSLRVWRIDQSLQKLCGHEPDEDVSVDLDDGDHQSCLSDEIQLHKFDDAISDIESEKSVPRESVNGNSLKPKSLQQEFSLINVNIPNVEIVKMDAERRTCTVTASSSGQFIMMQVNFPPKYPFNTTPVFQFCEGTTIDKTVMSKLLKELKKTAQQRVRKNRSCLEPCLRHLVTTLEKFSLINEENIDTSQDYLKMHQPFLSTTLNNSFHDAYIPFPRTSGAKFCSVNMLVCFGRPPNARRLSVKPESSTPRAMSALGNQSSVLYPMTGRTAAGNMSITAFYFQDRAPYYPSRNSRTTKLRSKHVPGKPMVTVYDVSKLFFVNRTLGERYVLDNNDPMLICQKNAVIAASVGRTDLVQAWTLASIAATTLGNQTVDSKNLEEDDITWTSHPCGRALIESLINDYAKKSDIQMAAMLSCVFSRPTGTFEVRTRHKSSHSPGGSPYHTIPPPADAVDIWSFPIRKPTRSNSLDDLKLSEQQFPVEESSANDCYILDDKNTALYDSYKKFYAEILYRWNLLYARSQVLKFLSTTPESHRGVEFLTDCHYCDRPSRGPNCNKCRKMSFSCIVCHISVRGSSNFCLICGHGGHTKHLLEWFRIYDVCPTGCGCKCLTDGANVFS
ncbi:GATOR complex protein WDR59 isoform X2 [Chrysoperla carnea]|uniref:GATOR complex protein WDR59 isoform X2 n=1 Tax=Chrysoperla carnea TaxID=189513 RepID=UPI001D074FC6|nr:GATOR complex protein WDR59 isoform X2 [Chrysoperla carnea]